LNSRQAFKRILPLAGIALFLVFLLPGCKGKVGPGQVEAKRPEVKGVAVATLSPSTVDAVYETSGTVRAGITSSLASRVFGTVTKVYVKEGDAVRAGDILLTIDDRDARQRMNGAEAALNEASKAREAAATQSGLADITSRRYGNLFKEKVVSEQEFDQIEAQKNVAKLELERATLAVGRAKALLEETRVHLGFTEIRAPFSGTITAKRVEQGAMASPGMPLVTVEDTSSFKIEVYVDERLSGKLKPGSPVMIRLDATGETVPGTITKVVPAVDPATRSFAIEAGLKGKTFRSGVYARILIPEGTKQVILVPRSSVVEKGRLTGVYAVDEKGVVNYRLIRKGTAFSDGMEVLSGLKSGDRIIVGGMDKAVDGGILKDR
jgi:RND family efflux transporter MFP subunit